MPENNNAAESAEQEHLWTVEHPYYCEDSNYMGASKTWTDYRITWRGFVEAGSNTWDPELNLVFRWDWKCADEYRDDHDGDDPWWGPLDVLFLFVMLQRKGHYRVIRIDVSKDDEPAVREFLVMQWAALAEVWAPLAKGSP